MVTLKIVFNEKTRKLLEDIIINWEDRVIIDAYNEDSVEYRKKANGIKNYFASESTPFIGVFEENIPIKGFYDDKGVKEHERCNYKNVNLYLINYFSKNG